jgi:hypothetical protein
MLKLLRDFPHYGLMVMTSDDLQFFLVVCSSWQLLLHAEFITHVTGKNVKLQAFNRLDFSIVFFCCVSGWSLIKTVVTDCSKPWHE